MIQFHIPSEQNIVGTLAVDGWGVTVHLVQQGRHWAVLQPALVPPPRCTKCNGPPINGQCTNHCIAV